MTTNRDWEALIHKIAQGGGRVEFTDHAWKQMDARDISSSMAMDTLRNGRIVRPPQVNDATGETKCRMEHYCAGEEVRVVVAVTGAGANMAVVITAFTTSE